MRESAALRPQALVGDAATKRRRTLGAENLTGPPGLIYTWKEEQHTEGPTIPCGGGLCSNQSFVSSPDLQGRRNAQSCGAYASRHVIHAGVLVLQPPRS